jgi:hypothetical protein
MAQQSQKPAVLLALSKMHGVQPPGTFQLPVTNHDAVAAQNQYLQQITFMSFLRKNFISFGLFILILVVFVYAALTFVVRPGSNSIILIHGPSETKSVENLFVEKPPPPLPPPPPPILELPPPQQKNFDMVFHLAEGVLYDSNDTSVRVFDLGNQVLDMDMLSIVFFSCCCNDKSIVVCDNRKPASSAALQSHPTKSLVDYSVNCYLSHDPSVPAMNTEHIQYKHRWKLILEFGPAFETSLGSTDCVFSTVYYSSLRQMPPPPNPPASELAKKIW